MTAILLDIDGVLHVSGDPIPGAADAVRALRADGHQLRFVTNNTTRARAGLARELQAIGIELDEDEISTTPIAAGKLLEGMRVLALTMSSVREDLAARHSRGGKRRGGAPRRSGRDRRDGRGLCLREPQPDLCGLARGREACLLAQESLVADGRRTASRRRSIRGRAGVRGP